MTEIQRDKAILLLLDAAHCMALFCASELRASDCAQEKVKHPNYVVQSIAEFKAQLGEQE